MIDDKVTNTFLATYYLNIIGIGKYKQRINKLEKDIEELREYSEE